MKKRRENWAEQFERKQEEREDFISNISKKKKLESYNEEIKQLKEQYSNEKSKDYKNQITILENMLDIYYKIKGLFVEGVEVDLEIKKLEENINYLKFKQNYIERYNVDEMEISEVTRRAELQEMYEEEEIYNLKQEKIKNNKTSKLKEILDKSKDAQSWEEYRKEEEEKER